MDIAHFARGFYSTPGLVLYLFPKISFLENSHFLVSLTTQHAVPVGTQYTPNANMADHLGGLDLVARKRG